MQIPDSEGVRNLLYIFGGVGCLLVIGAIAWRISGLNKFKVDLKNKTAEVTDTPEPKKRVVRRRTSK